MVPPATVAARGPIAAVLPVAAFAGEFIRLAGPRLLRMSGGRAGSACFSCFSFGLGHTTMACPQARTLGMEP